MARRRRSKKREQKPDHKYNLPLVTKFINSFMWDGKKSICSKIFYEAIDIITEKMSEDGIEVFKRAINNVKPIMEVRPRRIGGATYQVPMEVRQDRRISLAIKWIITAARQRNEKSFAEKLANELIAASKKEGNAFKMREDTHRMAEANKAFAHFRW